MQIALITKSLEKSYTGIIIHLLNGWPKNKVPNYRQEALAQLEHCFTSVDLEPDPNLVPISTKAAPSP